RFSHAPQRISDANMLAAGSVERQCLLVDPPRLELLAQPYDKVAQAIQRPCRLPRCPDRPEERHAPLVHGARFFYIDAPERVHLTVRGDLIGCSILFDRCAAAFETADVLVSLTDPAKEGRLQRKSIRFQALALLRFISAAFRRSAGVEYLLQECDGIKLTRAYCNKEAKSNQCFPQPFPLPALKRPLPGAAHILKLTLHLVQGLKLLRTLQIGVFALEPLQVEHAVALAHSFYSSRFFVQFLRSKLAQ